MRAAKYGGEGINRGRQAVERSDVGKIREADKTAKGVSGYDGEEKVVIEYT